MCGIPLASAPQATRRPAGSGWWGVIFGLGLLAVGGMVSLPTAAQSGEEIQVFYSAHRQIIIIQQLVGVVLLVPFLAFARTLDRRSFEWAAANAAWLMPAAIAVAAADLATVVVPFALAAIPEPSPATAHTLTFAVDLADAGLFATIALFSFVAAPADWSWLRGLGLLVAALTLIRALASPIGVTFMDAIAPIAFLAYVLVLSTRTILVDRGRRT